MAYDDTSFWGDMIVDEYDEKNNLMNPVSPTGYLFYHLIGGGFDAMSDMCSTFLNDCSVLSCEASSLDKFWGVSYSLPRPTLPESGRLLTDDEYRVYLYLSNCRLLTVEDIIINFNKCFSVNDFAISLSKETHYLETVDHTHYAADESISSNITKNNTDTSKHYITNHESDDDTETFESLLSTVQESETIVNIPPNSWSREFLDFLEQYISIKGNLRIKESLK